MPEIIVAQSVVLKDGEKSTAFTELYTSASYWRFLNAIIERERQEKRREIEREKCMRLAKSKIETKLN